MQTSTADRKSVRAAEKEAKVADAQRGAVIREIMTTTQGREWMWNLLESCHVFASTFTPNPLSTAFSEGERNVGLRLMADIMMNCPDQYIQAQREHNERSSIDASAAERRRGEEPDGRDSGREGAGGDEAGYVTDYAGDGYDYDRQGPASNTEGEKKPAAAAPETYADFKVPDNYTLDPKAVEAALPVFKELGLTQDQAQKLVDIQVQRELAIAKGPSEAYAATRADWQSKVLADAEIKAYTTDGKTGIDAVKVDIGRALGTLPPELAAEFRSAMDITGAGDHPAFVKAMWKFAQAIGEGKHVIGKGPSPAGQVDPSRSNKPSPAQAMYPNLS